MPDEHGQIRRDHPEWPVDVHHIANQLEHEGAVHIGYAAEMSLHPIVVIDGRHFEGNTFGPGPSGIPRSELSEWSYWSVSSWDNGSDWYSIGTITEPGKLVSDKTVRNEVDAVAIAILMNYVDRERARLRGLTWTVDLKELEAEWLRDLGSRSQLAQKLGLTP